MDISLVTDVLKEAITFYPKPEIGERHSISFKGLSIPASLGQDFYLSVLFFNVMPEVSYILKISSDPSASLSWKRTSVYEYLSSTV